MKIRRTLGKRTSAPAGVLRPPSPEEREWARRMAVRRTRVPKGVFRYPTMEEANADWERWQAEGLADGVHID